MATSSSSSSSTTPAAFDLFDTKTCPTVLGFDENYAYYAYVAMQSVLMRSSPYEVAFHVLHENLAEKAIEAGKRLFNTPRSSITFHDLSDHIKGQQTYVSAYWSRAMYYPMLIPELFSESERVIFLDADTCANANVFDMFRNFPEHALLGAVRDIGNKVGVIEGWPMRDDANHPHLPEYIKERNRAVYIRDILKLDNPDNYFNSGVLAFRPKNTPPEIKALLREALGWELAFPDQDILNTIFRDRLHLLGYEWNYQTGDGLASRLDPYWRKLRWAAAKHPKIIHYCGPDKPWAMAHVDDAHYWRLAQTALNHRMYALLPNPKETEQVIAYAMRRTRR